MKFFSDEAFSCDDENMIIITKSMIEELLYEGCISGQVRIITYTLLILNY